MRPTGHIRQRSSGSFEIRYSFGTDPATGKRRIATTTVKGNRRAAEKELRRLLRSLDTGEHVDPIRMTVRQWLAAWVATVREEVSPKTYERYSEIVNNFLAPELGALSIAKLTAATFRPPTPSGQQKVAATASWVGYPRVPVGTSIVSLTALSPAQSSNKCWHAIRAMPSKNGFQRSSAGNW